jgi:hypothetical protein
MPAFTAPKSYTAYAFKEKGAYARLRKSSSSLSSSGGNLEKVTVDWKDPQPGEIVVKVIACGVCAR